MICEREIGKVKEGRSRDIGSRLQQAKKPPKSCQNNLPSGAKSVLPEYETDVPGTPWQNEIKTIGKTSRPKEREHEVNGHRTVSMADLVHAVLNKVALCHTVAQLAVLSSVVWRCVTG
jgi:hypothetical protein